MTTKEFSNAIANLKLIPMVDHMDWLLLDKATAFVEDFFFDNDFGTLKRLFPNLLEPPEHPYLLSNYLCQYNLCGFLAELAFPSITESSFNDEGDIDVLDSTYDLTIKGHAYGESLEELYKEIEKVHNQVLQNQIDKIKRN